MNIKEQTRNMSSDDRKNLVKEIIERCVSAEPPIEDSPYIHVVFCKGYNGWVPFTGYGCDISSKKAVEFINCINDAADVLNGKEKVKIMRDIHLDSQTQSSMGDIEI